MAGYSKRSLVDKLGIKDGWAIAILNAPKEYARTLGKLPSGVTRKSSPVGPVDFIQFFTKEKRELERRFAALARALAPAGMLWISWPKQASSVENDLTEDVIRNCPPLFFHKPQNERLGTEGIWVATRFDVIRSHSRFD